MPTLFVPFAKTCQCCTLHQSISFSLGIFRESLDTMDKKHYNIRVYGKVQGVFFRASARHHAEMLGITGFAQNENDGSVNMEVEGTEENLNLFIEWCHEGSERAEVSNVEVTIGPVRNFEGFEVNRGMY